MAGNNISRKAVVLMLVLLLFVASLSFVSAQCPANRYHRYRKCYGTVEVMSGFNSAASCLTSQEDDACCEKPDDCVKMGSCYTESYYRGANGGALSAAGEFHPESRYVYNGEAHICAESNWFDPDRASSYCEALIGDDSLHTVSDLDGRTKFWAKKGKSQNFGEYDLAKGSTECCGDDYGEFFIEGQTDDSGACCDAPTDCVWDYSCYSSGYNIHNLGGEARLCIDGMWISASDLNYRWDEVPDDTFSCLTKTPKTCGYCLNNTQCFVTEGHCVDSGYSVIDYLCENGAWSSKTKLVALQLLKLANISDYPNDYALFCDDYEKSANYFGYAVGSLTAWNFLEGFRNPDVYECDDSNTIGPDPCVNRVCVLVYHEREGLDTVEKRAFGATLNKPIGKYPYPFSSLVYDDEDCNSAAGRQQPDDIYGQYYQCSNKRKAWYNNKTKSIIYSNEAIFLEKPNFQQSFTEFLSNPFAYTFDLIMDIIRPLHPEGIEPQDFSFIEYTKDFSRIYLARSGARSIRGIIEKNMSKTAGKMEFLSVTYNCFASDICAAVNAYDLKYVEQDPEGGWGRISCDTYNGNSYVQYAPIEARNAYYGFRTWLDLTAKTRIQDIGQPLDNGPIAYIKHPGNGMQFAGGNAAEVSFKGAAEGCNAPFSYSWTDSKGEYIPDVRSPTATLAQPGTHTVSLTVQDDDGDTDTVFIEIEVVLDTTPPDAPTNFNAAIGNAQLMLLWANPDSNLPQNSDFAGVIVLRKEGSYPTSPADGSVVYEGTAAYYLDTGLTNNITYYYSVFSYDNIPNYSAAAQTSAMPAECYTHTLTDTLTQEFEQGSYNSSLVDVSGDEIKLRAS